MGLAGWLLLVMCSLSSVWIWRYVSRDAGIHRTRGTELAHWRQPDQSVRRFDLLHVLLVGGGLLNALLFLAAPLRAILAGGPQVTSLVLAGSMVQVIVLLGAGLNLLFGRLVRHSISLSASGIVRGTLFVPWARLADWAVHGARIKLYAKLPHRPVALVLAPPSPALLQQALWIISTHLPADEDLRAGGAPPTRRRRALVLGAVALLVALGAALALVPLGWPDLAAAWAFVSLAGVVWSLGFAILGLYLTGADLSALSERGLERRS